VIDPKLNPQDVEGVFKFFDFDKSGSITIEEFRDNII